MWTTRRWRGTRSSASTRCKTLRDQHARSAPLLCPQPTGSPMPATQPATLTQGIDHYENFPVASWLCPARLRPAILAVYGFARTADDIADEGHANPEQRLADLAQYRAELVACADGHTLSERWPKVFSALAPHLISQMGSHVLRTDFPVGLLNDLLLAFEQDVHASAASHWYNDHSDLFDYCALSANPIGRILLHLYGVSEAEALDESDAICTALQLINFWQDLSQDIPLQRYYLPRDLMAIAKVSRQQVIACRDQSNTMSLIAACADIARTTMQKGYALPARIRRQQGGFNGWRAALELRCVIQGGLRILDKIRALNYRTLDERPKLGRWDAAVVLWRALTM
jgi:hydroxysqualene synthase